MPKCFYYIESRHKKIIIMAILRYKKDPYFLLNDGSLLIYTQSFSRMLIEFKCGLGDAKEIVEEAESIELLRWYRDVIAISRIKNSKTLRGRNSG